MIFKNYEMKFKITKIYLFILIFLTKECNSSILFYLFVMKEPEAIYNHNVSTSENVLQKLKKHIKLLSIIRIVLFLLIIILIYELHKNSVILSICLTILIPAFFFFVEKNAKLIHHIKYRKALIVINKNEIEALNDNYSIFDNGAEFVNTEHPYSYDLDIFGEGSLFQCLNRTGTCLGKKTLAAKISIIQTDKEGIIKRQIADKELCRELDWRQDFLATAQINAQDTGSKISEAVLSEIKTRARIKHRFLNKRIFKIFYILLPAINVLSILSYIFAYTPASFIIFSGILNLIFTGIFLKVINQEHSGSDKIKHSLKLAEKLIVLTENKSFESPYLNEIKTLFKIKGKSGIQFIKKYNSLIQLFDARLNILTGVLLNALLLWDFRILIQLEKHKTLILEHIDNWFFAIGEFDALISLSNYSYNRRENTYPEIINEHFQFEMINGGHPLISKHKRVTNDFKIDNLHEFGIITGANMSGKSTFLRTIGIHMILGSAGTSVCAEHIKFSPIQLFTSLRTGDSLYKNESFFFAEIKRLKRIIDFLNTEKACFIILDEILKGTNSKDKHHGSVGLIKKLVQLNASGLFATHDIQIGELSDKFPSQIFNNCFEVEIQNDELVFDYKIKPGISRNLSATFLMKKHKIIE